MIKRFSACLTLSALALTCALTPLSASAGEKQNKYVDAGKLVCHKTGPGINILIHSQFPIECIYTDHEGKTEKYTGKTGVALGVSLTNYDKVDLTFIVLAGGKLNAGEHAMKGNYVGGHVSIAAGDGAGVDVLVGGGAKNISLQPFAGEQNKGVGIAAGLGFLKLN